MCQLGGMLKVFLLLSEARLLRRNLVSNFSLLLLCNAVAVLQLSSPPLNFIIRFANVLLVADALAAALLGGLLRP